MSTGFHTQGPVPLDSLAYLARAFESAVFQEVLAGRWVLLLGPRQHGKTTGLIRIRHAIRQAGVRVATIDLQRLPPTGAYPEFLRWCAGRIAADLDVAAVLSVSGDAGELETWLEAVVPVGPEPLVLIIDEASGIPIDEWRNSFYGQIRAISGERAEAPHDSVAARLRFIFAGTFRPESLVDERNSPFNVCQRIDTEDLTEDDAKSLWLQVVGQPDDELIKRAFDLVGGQPYLLQSLFDRAAASTQERRGGTLSVAMDELLTGNDPHFEGIFSKVYENRDLARIVDRMRIDGTVDNVPASGDYRFLQVIGLAKRDGHVLHFRNQIYHQYANRTPFSIEESAVITGGSRLTAMSLNRFSCMSDAKLREIAASMYRGAIQAHNGGSYRLALVGFGSALEALLVDWLMSRPPATLATAVSSATSVTWSNYEDRNQPITWRLVNLMAVSRAISGAPVIVDPPRALRDWRNLVHAGVALTNYFTEPELLPESTAASGHFEAMFRDISAAY